MFCAPGREIQLGKPTGPLRAPFSLSSAFGHNDGVIDEIANPCRAHGCHVCCVETRMTLTLADIRRLESAGFSDFARENREGDLELRNRDGRCVFLEDGRCRVYDQRPVGCQLYPLILDLGLNRVVRDDYCPHHEEFPIDPGAVSRLRRSVARESVEATQRRRRRSG